MRRKRLSLITSLVLLVLLFGGLGWTIYSPIRQERLNRTLLAAIKQNDTKTALSLLAEGADPNARDKPPVSFSFKRMLLQLFHKPAPAMDSPMALTLAMGVQIQADTYGSGLFCCEDDYDEAGGVQIVKALCEHGADVNSRGPGGYTPLMASAMTPASATITKILLDRGAQVNARSNDGTTALMLAASDSNPQTITLLLDSGADVNAHDNQGNTPLIETVEVTGNGPFLANMGLLIARHARVNMRNKNEESALMLAQRNAKQDKRALAFVKLLQQAGAKE